MENLGIGWKETAEEERVGGTRWMTERVGKSKRERLGLLPSGRSVNTCDASIHPQRTLSLDIIKGGVGLLLGS